MENSYGYKIVNGFEIVVDDVQYRCDKIDKIEEINHEDK